MVKVPIEDVKRALMEFAHKPPELLAPLKAMADGTLPEYYLSKLKWCRSFSDELPEPDVDETHPDYRYLKLQAMRTHPAYPNLKCRLSNLGHIHRALSSSIDYEVIVDDMVIQKIKEYGDHDFNGEKGNGPKGEYWTTRAEIDLTNETLDLAIAHIKETYGL